jgi:hypothetical protein
MIRRSLGHRSLGHDITLALMLKLVLLSLLYVAFFRADARPAIDAGMAAQHLLSPLAGPAPTGNAR